MSSTTTNDGSSSSGQGKKAILEFLIYDEDKDTTRAAFFVQTTPSMIDTGYLYELRRVLANSPESKDYVKYLFTSSKGAIIPDAWTVKEYITRTNPPQKSNQSTSTTDQSTSTTNPPTSTTDQSTSTTNPPTSTTDQSTSTSGPSTSTTQAQSAPAAQASTIGLGPFNVYMKKDIGEARRSLKDTTIPTPKELMDALDNKVPEGKLLSPPEIKELLSSFVAANWQATAAPVASNAADLGEKEWGIVALDNELFYGICIVRTKNPSGPEVYATGLSNARRAAFQFKQRNIPTYQNSINTTHTPLRVPRFSVDDSSYVSVFETANSFQAAMARSSFSELDIKAAVSGGALGISVGASFGFGMSDNQASAAQFQSTTNMMHIAYNFPRVSILLDEEVLEMTDQCKKDLALVQNAATLQTFLKLYGEIFTSRVQLGGRLYASQASSTFAGSSVEEKAKSMKISASISVGTPFVSGSVGMGYGFGSQSSNSASQSSLSNNLLWEATGGNTLLCNNPPAWCPTVSSFYNWRIIKQDNITSLLDVIGKQPGYADIISMVKGFVSDKTMDPTKLAELNVPPDEIYLEYPSSTGPSLYFSVANTSVRSLADAASVSVDKAAPDIAAKQQDILASMKTQLASLGACFLQKECPDSNLSGRYFKIENPDGSPVKTANYGTRYRLRNTATGLRPRARIEGNFQFVEASPFSSDLFVFVDETQSKSGPIATGDIVKFGILEGGAAVLGKVWSVKGLGNVDVTLIPPQDIKTQGMKFTLRRRT